MISLIIYSLTMFVLLLFSWRKPGIVVGSSLCMFGFEQLAQSTNTYFVQNSALTNILLASLVIVACVRQFIRYGIAKSSYKTTGILVILLYVYAFTSVLWSPTPSLSIERWYISGPYVVTYIIFAPLVLYTKSDIDDALKAIIIMGVLITIILLLGTEWSGRGVVVAGVINKYGNAQFANPLVPASIAGYTAICATLTYYWNTSKLWLITRYVIIGLAIALAIRTGSRGQALSLVIVLISFWSFRKKLSIGSVIPLIFFSIITLFTFESLIEVFWSGSNRWNSNLLANDLGGRFDNAIVLIDKWIGGGLFSITFGLGNSASFDPRILGYYPHIVLLEVLGEEGIIGILMITVIFSIVYKKFLFLLKITSKNMKERSISITLMGLFVYLFLLSFKQGSLLESYQLFLIGIIISKYSYIVGKEIAPNRS